MYRSLCFLLVLAITAHATQYEPLPHLDLDDKCKKEANIAEDKEIDDDFAEVIKAAETDHSIKCFLACRARELQMIDEKGVLRHESLVADIPSHVKVSPEAKDAIAACGSKGGTDFCDRAYNSIKCLSEDASILELAPDISVETEIRELEKATRPMEPEVMLVR